ncbi:MAG: Holliday junction resolvase RuvX [Clostridiales bacterium]|jgi:putative Holliday junction resolvase|nr:Holliday junction resolvase RuvX [Clostridiales bacterium]
MRTAKRYLALDYGDKNIGVAVSDPTGTIATPVETIRRGDPTAINASVKRVKELLGAYNADEIILGFPVKMDGTEGKRCEITRAFAEKLKRRLKASVILWDERFSTVSALKAAPSVSANGYQNVDMMAAVYFLQNYLDHKKGEHTMEHFDEDIITMLGDNGEEQRYVVMDEKEYNGSKYLLVVEEDARDDDDAEASIIKAVDFDSEDEIYEFLEDDDEFNTVAELFQENEDYDIEF